MIVQRHPVAEFAGDEHAEAGEAFGVAFMPVLRYARRLIAFIAEASGSSDL